MMGKVEKRVIICLVVLLELGIIIFLGVKLKQQRVAPVSIEESLSGKITLPPGFSTLNPDKAQEIAVTATRPKEQSSDRTGNTQLLAIVTTGIFTLMGSTIVLIFNFVSSSSTRKFEWAKHIWNQYQDSYLELRNTLKSTIDAHVLETKMNSLRKKMFLPKSLDEHFEHLLSVLKSTGSVERKEKAVQMFAITLDRFIVRPWEHF